MTVSFASFAIAGFLGLALFAAAALRGWEGWLALRRLELETGRRSASTTTARIELASLRERVRRLEAIAAGIEL